MSERIFVSVPDGPYWEAKRAREAGQELEAVRGPEERGVLEDVGCPYNQCILHPKEEEA